jgi:hypothetical protein
VAGVDARRAGEALDVEAVPIANLELERGGLIEA